MYAWEPDKHFGLVTSIEERMKIMYNQHVQSPTHSVPHYISYLRRYVSKPGESTTVSGSNDKKAAPLTTETRPTEADGQRSTDSISPLSYFIRKLKLDLKMSVPSFVEEFLQAPNNGLHLLLSLLKIIQSTSLNPIGQANMSAAKGTLKMDSYKQNMVDEQDCLLCIKYTLINRAAVEEMLNHSTGIFIVTTCLLSNFSRSRIAALEILSLVINGPSSVDKILDAFTSMRVRYGESTRFKMLIGMMHTRGVSHVLFQVSCLRLLNNILNRSKSANMRVFLQYEMEDAGLNCTKILEGAQGDGLEFDDLRKEVREWRMRYINVDSILQKIKADLKADCPGNAAMTEFHYDMHYGLAGQGPIAPDVEELLVRNTECDLRHRTDHQHRVDHEFSSSPIIEQSTLFLLPSNTSTVPTKSGKLTISDTHTDANPESLNVKRTMVDTSSMSPGNSYLPESHSTDAVGCPTAFRDDFGNPQNTHGVSITSEIYEPYGLLLKTTPHNIECQESGSSDKNWTLGDPVQEVRWTRRDQVNIYRKSGKHELYRTDTVSDQYDSGVCENYPDTDQGEELFQTYWRNCPHPGQQVFDSIEKTEDFRKLYGSYQHKDNHGARAINHNCDVPEQGPSRWYIPSSSHPHPISHRNPVHQRKDHANHGGGNLKKPPSPFPDYSCDDIEEPELPFIPKSSSTVRAPSSKNSSPASLIRAANVHQRYTDKDTSNTNSQIWINAPPSNGLKRKPASRFAHTNHQGLQSPQPSLRDESNRSDNSSFDSRQGINPPSLSVRNNYTSQASLSQGPDFHLQVTPTFSNSNYAKNCQDDKRSITPQSIYDNHQSLDTNNGSISRKQQFDKSSFHYNGSIKTPGINNPRPALRDENHDSRSLISWTTNECTETVQGNSELKSGTQSFNESKVFPRRPSVSEIVSTIERRNSLEATTRFGGFNEDCGRSISQISLIGSGHDSVRSYSAEVGRVLGDLDQALEKHGWQASFKKKVKHQSSPLGAFV